MRKLMTDESTPYWVLLSVLFSSVPLTPSLAMALHQAAFELFRRGGSSTEVAGDLMHGRVTNLKKHVVLGEIAGPAFEADLETERGKGRVRFLLTREGLEHMGAQPAAESRRMLN
jgi:hypothetical protein